MLASQPLSSHNLVHDADGSIILPTPSPLPGAPRAAIFSSVSKALFPAGSDSGLTAGRLSALADAPANSSPDTHSEWVAAAQGCGRVRKIEERVQAVVARSCFYRGRCERRWAGSGVVVSKDGLVMTAGHVVGKPGQPVTFFFANGKSAKGTTLGVYPSGDAGLMKITDKGDWPYVEKGRSGDLKLGSWCVTLGHPLGIQHGRPRWSASDAFCTPSQQSPDRFPIVSGDSGGPVFDLDGRSSPSTAASATRWTRTCTCPSICSPSIGTAWSRARSPGGPSPPRRSGHQDRPPPVVTETTRCVVRVTCDGSEAALGTIVGPDGWILTKASELRGKIVCRLADQRDFEARIVGINPAFDLAMLKIEAGGLPVIPWLSKDPAVGQWVPRPG